MGRNLYFLAGSLGLFGTICLLLSLTGVAQAPGTPGDASLWRLTGLVLLVLSLVTALSGVLSSLFEQAERRATEQRQQGRRRRTS